MNLDSIISAARKAFEEWSQTSLDERISLARNFARQLARQKQSLSQIISEETGKPRWESLAEVDAMIAKVDLAIMAHHERRSEQQIEQNAFVRFKPYGVLAVFGPFNMPGHLPNGHMVPAILAGNAIIFKPSEYTPRTGEQMTAAWRDAGAPAGLINIVDASRESGIALSQHRDIDGLLFTGSVEVGTILNRAFADCPGKILALEMGGNNPLIVHDVKNLDAAVYLTILSAFITSGQRCSCARRLILPPGNEAFVERLVEMSKSVRVGKWDDEPQPFMGRVISEQAARKILKAQEDLVSRGAKAILEMKLLDGKAMLSPGIVDVSASKRSAGILPAQNEVGRGQDANATLDVEIFGPLLQVIRVDSFDDAIAEANNTRYGLVAGLISDDKALWPTFYKKVRAGLVYFNRQTTGASSRLPFGGIGISGNNRPSGYWASDYCSYPVSVMEAEVAALPAKLLPGIEL